MAEPFPVARIPAASQRIAARLIERGHAAWFVGGAVRDVLFERLHGRAPRRTGDFDIATSALPEEVRRLFPRTVPVGIEHGTVAVLDESGVPHEVTTFRRDVKTDGRHAVVEFGVSLEDDLARRDFTVNAIAVHPASGELRDPFAGLRDIEARRLAAVGEAAQRFLEDRLRVLRALRFAAALELDIEPHTWDALVAAVSDLEHLSRERVREEWRKTLESARPSVGVALWRRSGALAAVWPELAPLDAVERLDRFDDHVLVSAAALAWSGASRAAAETALRRLRFSNAEVERVGAAVEGVRGRGPGIGDPAAVRRWMSATGPAVDDVLAIWEAAGSAAGLRAAVEAVRASGAPLTLRDLAISGDDLIAAGIPAGPQLGELLRRLLDEVLADPSRNNRAWLLRRAAELR